MGAMNGQVGIEKIRYFPTTLGLEMSDLCAARGFDERYVLKDLFVEARGVNPVFEDSVTMAVNVAKPMLEGVDLDSIGLLIVGTESSVDQEKPVSSWVHRYLNLRPDCRNFEVKHACYGMTGALQLALGWLASGLARDRKALLISTDQSLPQLTMPWEPCTGAGAVAVLLSSAPRLVSYELGRNGVRAAEVSDVFRPTPRIEMGNSETSLLSYLDALDEALAAYVERVPESRELDAYFDWHVYHMPFPGIASRAHRAVLQNVAGFSRAEAQQHFERKCQASTTFARRVGGCYGSSTFVGLMGLVDAAPVQTGDRVGIFAYGSGSCAEFQSVRVLNDARTAVAEAGLAERLAERRTVSVAEYEALERERDASVMVRDYVPNYEACGDWYARRYEGRTMLVLDKIDGYYRHYRWS